jgi:hypothetical protein
MVSKTVGELLQQAHRIGQLVDDLEQLLTRARTSSRKKRC